MAINSLRDDLMREVAVHQSQLHARRECVVSEGSAEDSSTAAHPATHARRRSRGADLVRPALWDVVASFVGLRSAERRRDTARGVNSSELFMTVMMDDATRAWVESELESRQPHFERQESRINEIADFVGVAGVDGNIVEPISLVDDEVMPYYTSAAPAPASAALPLPADPVAGEEPVHVIESEVARQCRPRQ